VPLLAEEGGFDLHAPVTVPAGDRERLAQLCRYLCRPPLGQQRLRDGRIALVLQRPWANGATHLLFTPSELLARLVPLVLSMPPARDRDATAAPALDRRPAYRCAGIGRISMISTESPGKTEKCG